MYLMRFLVFSRGTGCERGHSVFVGKVQGVGDMLHFLVTGPLVHFPRSTLVGTCHLYLRRLAWLHRAQAAPRPARFKGREPTNDVDSAAHLSNERTTLQVFGVFSGLYTKSINSVLIMWWNPGGNGSLRAPRTKSFTLSSTHVARISMRSIRSPPCCVSPSSIVHRTAPLLTRRLAEVMDEDGSIVFTGTPRDHSDFGFAALSSILEETSCGDGRLVDFLSSRITQASLSQASVAISHHAALQSQTMHAAFGMLHVISQRISEGISEGFSEGISENGRVEKTSSRVDGDLLHAMLPLCTYRLVNRTIKTSTERTDTRPPLPRLSVARKEGGRSRSIEKGVCFASLRLSTYLVVMPFAPYGCIYLFLPFGWVIVVRGLQKLTEAQGWVAACTVRTKACVIGQPRSSVRALGASSVGLFPPGTEGKALGVHVSVFGAARFIVGRVVAC